MKDKQVDITIRTLQRRSDGAETLRQKAEGTLCREGEGWVLRYQEGEASGLGDTLTNLRLEEGRAVLERAGETASRMVFQVGEPYVCRYATPYGELSMTVKTLRLDWALDETGGKAFIVYKLQLGGAEVGENRLWLTVKTKENGYDR